MLGIHFSKLCLLSIICNVWTIFPWKYLWLYCMIKVLAKYIGYKLSFWRKEACYSSWLFCFSWKQIFHFLLFCWFHKSLLLSVVISLSRYMNLISWYFLSNYDVFSSNQSWLYSPRLSSSLFNAGPWKYIPNTTENLGVVVSPYLTKISKLTIDFLLY